MQQMTVLDLYAPKQQKPDRSSFDLGRRAVDRWLGNLPSAHVGESSKALLAALQEVNALDVRPAVRIRFLESIGEHVDGAVRSLRRHYLSTEFPLPNRNRKIAELAATLLQELAIGYHCVVQQTGRRAYSALAIERTMQALGRLLVERYSLYQPAPEGLWRTLHDLYAVAEERGVTRRRVGRRGKRGSVEDAYKQILLFAAAGPYRMRHSEAGDVYDSLARWTAHTRLVRVSGGRQLDPAFVIDQQSDTAPLYHATPAALSGDLRMLDTSALAKVADIVPRRWWWQFWRPSLTKADTDIARRVVVALGALPSRQSARLPVKARAQVLVGLPAIHRSLTAQRGFDLVEVDVDVPQFTSREPRRRDVARDDVWTMQYGAELLQRMKQPPKEEAAAAKNSPPQAQNWRLLNISTGGYCLLSDRAQSTRAQVGELVTLREIDNKSHRWQIGVVRWMRQVGDALQIGVQVLGADPLPVLTKNALPDGGFGPADRSLLLPQDSISGRPRALLVTPLRYAAERRVLLNEPDREHEVVLTRLMESSSGFAQFEFQPIALAVGMDRSANDALSMI